MDTFKDTSQNPILTQERWAKGRFFQAEGEEKICLWPILTILLKFPNHVAGDGEQPTGRPITAVIRARVVSGTPPSLARKVV